MAKYILELHGEPVRGKIKTLKKYNLDWYELWYMNGKEILLFPSERQAKIWLLGQSTFPKFAEYLTCNELSDELIDKMYLKGNYIIRDTRTLICEYSIVEYEV